MGKPQVIPLTILWELAARSRLARLSAPLDPTCHIPVVGEESTAEDPSRLAALSEQSCWLVDPVDGTSNFVAGRREYAAMVAPLRNGDPVAGWILVGVPVVVAEKTTDMGLGPDNGAASHTGAALSPQVGRCTTPDIGLLSRVRLGDEPQPPDQGICPYPRDFRRLLPGPHSRAAGNHPDRRQSPKNSALPAPRR